MTSDELASVAARLTLGLTGTVELRSVADAALRDGIDAPSLVALMGAHDDEARAVFDRVLDELHVSKPTVREAVLRLARDAASEIVGGAVAPYTGAKRIWDLTLRAPNERIPELDPFIYAASEWEERPDDRIRFERDILSEARAFTNR